MRNNGIFKNNACISATKFARCGKNNKMSNFVIANRSVHHLTTWLFFNNIWQQLRYFFYFNYYLLSRSRHQRACALFTPESRHFPKWQYTYIKNFKKFICWYCCCTHTTWNILYWERSYTIEYNVNKRYQLNWKNFAASKNAL